MKRLTLIVLALLVLLWVWSILLPVAALGAGIHIPVPVTKKKRLVAPSTHGATQLMFAAAVPPFFTTNHFTLFYPPNATAALGWELQSSTNLTNWTVRIYPVLSNEMTVIDSRTNSKMFYRVRGRN